MNIKRILTGVLAGAFLTTMTAFTAAAASETDGAKLGDPTGDGKINAVDASNILSLYADVSVGEAEFTEAIMSICDVNKDGSINAMDASLVLSYYAAVETDETDQELEDFISSLITDVTDYFSIDPDMWDKESLEWPVYPWGLKIDPETGELSGELENWDPWDPENPWNPFNPLLNPDSELTEEDFEAMYPWDPWNTWDTFNDPDSVLPEDGINPWEPWEVDWNIYDTVDEQAEAIVQGEE